MKTLFTIAFLILALTCFAEPPLYQLKLRHESKTLVGIVKTDLTAAFFPIEASKDGGQSWQFLFYAYPNQEFVLPSSAPHIRYRAFCIRLRPPPA